MINHKTQLRSTAIACNDYGFLQCGINCPSVSSRNKDNRMHEPTNIFVNPHCIKPMLAPVVLLSFVIVSCLVVPLKLLLNCQWRVVVQREFVVMNPVLSAVAELHYLLNYLIVQDKYLHQWK